MRGDDPIDRPPGRSGIDPAELLGLPASDRRLMNWLIRRGSAALTEITRELNLSDSEAAALIAGLIERGFVQRTDEAPDDRYRAAFAPRRSSRLSDDLWKKLE